jgi:hypothetical protein
MSTRNRVLRTVTIASGASLSDEVNLDGLELEAVHMPAAWDAADLTFQAATVKGGAYQNVHDDAGTEIAVTAAAARAIPIGTRTKRLRGLHFIKVRSGTAALPVNQTAAREIVLALKAKG